MTRFKLNEVALGFEYNLPGPNINVIRHLDKDGAFIEEFSTLDPTAISDDMTFDNKGNLYIANGQALYLGMIGVDAPSEAVFVTLVYNNFNTRPVITDKAGRYIYTADRNSLVGSTAYVIKKFDQDGNLIQSWSFPLTVDADANTEPQALALYDSETKLAWVTQNSLRVRSLDLVTNNVTTLFTLPSTILGFGASPIDIKTLDDGTFLITYSEEWLIHTTQAGVILEQHAPWEYINPLNTGADQWYRFDFTRGKSNIWIAYEDGTSPTIPVGAWQLRLSDYNRINTYASPRLSSDEVYAIAVNNRVSSGGSFGTVIGAT